MGNRSVARWRRELAVIEVAIEATRHYEFFDPFAARLARVERTPALEARRKNEPGCWRELVAFDSDPDAEIGGLEQIDDATRSLVERVEIGQHDDAMRSGGERALHDLRFAEARRHSERRDPGVPRQRRRAVAEEDCRPVEHRKSAKRSEIARR